MPTLTVLSRSDSFAALWPELCAEFGFDLARLADASELPGGRAPGLLLVNLAGSEDEAESLLRSLRAAGAAPLLVAARTDHRFAAAAVRAGADDYFALPADLDALRARLAAERREREARVEREQLAVAQRAAFDFGRIIGASPQLRAALDRAARVIPHIPATVLITGETGTGKELLAQAIHYNGPRATAPFVEVNCAAIPAHLLESELFGHERGAFTDARTAKPGLFEAADGGTLFLDEIGHLPFDLQGKILKAIEEKRIRRIGAVVARSVELRIVAATHVDLRAAVREGRFRDDLFYRLSIVPIHLPPLRERGEDVLLLAAHFLATLAAQYRVATPPLTAELGRRLVSYPWPGNVRELRNALERALLLGDGELSTAELFPDEAPPAPAAAHGLPFPAPLAEIERAAARSMLERQQGNKKAAAEALGISRSRLYRLLDPGV